MLGTDGTVGKCRILTDTDGNVGKVGTDGNVGKLGTDGKFRVLMEM